MGTRIEPTVGRVVWFWPADRTHSRNPEQPRAATIALVLEDSRCNLGYLTTLGIHLNAQDVPHWDGEGVPPPRPYWEWMPYQKGQAAKTEALEARLAPATR